MFADSQTLAAVAVVSDAPGSPFPVCTEDGDPVSVGGAAAPAGANLRRMCPGERDTKRRICSEYLSTETDAAPHHLGVTSRVSARSVCSHLVSQWGQTDGSASTETDSHAPDPGSIPLGTSYGLPSPVSPEVSGAPKLYKKKRNKRSRQN